MSADAAARTHPEYAFGLTGYPLGHSLSPHMHTAALRQAGLAGDYRLCPVAPGDPAGLEALVDRLRSGELHGLNVTIPHKQAVLPFLDERTPEARAIGAANCLYARAGRVIGHNTDAGAFLEDVVELLRGGSAEAGQTVDSGRAADPGLTAEPGRAADPGRALVLGAGGSARAVVYALARAGWSVALAARRVEQAAALASDLSVSLPGGEVDPLPLDAAALAGLRPRLLVNTTPLGMHPNGSASPWPSGLPFPPGAAVYDLVYNPRETLLVRAARAAGLRAETGLGMLVGQAAVAFELWTGIPADRAAMRAAVE
jgi:shikimate dehydrogenase